LDYALSKGSHFEWIAKRFERFGPIYREQLLDTRIVNICDVDAIAKVLHTDTKFQMRPGLVAIAETIEDDNGFGLVSNDYEAWHSDRSLLSPKLLRPKKISQLFPILNTVANDFVERLRFITQSDVKMDNIDRELNFCILELFASILFNQRLGQSSPRSHSRRVSKCKFGLDAEHWRTLLQRTSSQVHQGPGVLSYEEKSG
jgi:hypothetical protein